MEMSVSVEMGGNGNNDNHFQHGIRLHVFSSSKIQTDVLTFLHISDTSMHENEI